MTVSELLNAAQGLPFRPPREALEDRPFIVVAPHPDDESLGCGGLIADACRQGLRGKVVILSDGAGSHPNSKAYREDMLFLRLPDRFVPREGEEAERAIGSIVNCVRDIGAGSLFVSWRHDPHYDHGASYQIARQVKVGSAGSGCSSMSFGDIRFHPRRRLVRFAAASESASMRRRSKGSAAPLRRTARRQPILSTTILPVFFSRSTGLLRSSL
jgi:LmbE family N-acetylglucosaminyl deacetylase